MGSQSVPNCARDSNTGAQLEHSYHYREMTEDIRAPVLWRRPNAKTYSYNREFGSNYYQPMLDYVKTKDRQGVFFERPTERIELPDPAETYMNRPEPSMDSLSSGVYKMDRFLVKSYKNQAREVNESTAKTRMSLLNGVTARDHLPHSMFDNQQTHFDDVRLLKGAVPGRKQVNYYTTEIGILKNNQLFSDHCYSDHLSNVMGGNFTTDMYTGMGGITAEQKFYDPSRVQAYTDAIRFKDPQRTVPVLV